MVSLTYTRHRPKHARTGPPAHEAPKPTPVPQRFWRVMIWRDKKRRGAWCNPEHEDWMRSVGREYDRWRQDRQRG